MGNRIAWMVVVVLVLAGAYTLAYQSVQPHGSPEGQIRGTLMDALDALNHGSTSAAMSVVSSDYKDSTGNNRERLYLMAHKAAENRDYWSANIQSLQPVISGDQATVHLVVAIRRTEGGAVQQQPITLEMRKEKVNAWGIIPTTRWRITHAEDLPDEQSIFD